MTHALHAIWQRIKKAPHHGFAIPLSSVRSCQSCGIGDFEDLKLLVDLAKKMGMDTIQLLPINDTANDPSPYNPISSIALHPIYISLSTLPYKDQVDISLSELEKLNSAPTLPYHTVLEKKMEALSRYYKKTAPLFQKDPHFQQFCSTQKNWLNPYSLFKALSHYLKAPLSQWDNNYQFPNHTFYQRLCQQFESEAAFYRLLQYLCFIQLKQARAVAKEQGIFIMGDLPILVSRESVDVWHYGETLFDLDHSVGSPPSEFNPTGQNWGFPPLKIPALEKQKFAYWKEKFHYLENFYDLYRIDHVLGLFRFWIIERGRTAKQGKFLPSQTALMEIQGERLLKQLLSLSHMLPLAEDLGQRTPTLSKLLRSLEICSHKIFRYARQNNKEGRPFIPFGAYPELSMTSISNHDLEPLALWWQNRPEDAKQFCKDLGFSYEAHLTANMRLAILKQSHQSPSYFHINPLCEYLALFPNLSWADPKQDRINRPGFCLPTNWVYKCRPSLEEMLTSQPLLQTSQNLCSI